MRAAAFSLAAFLLAACSGGKLADLGDGGPPDAAPAPTDAATTPPPVDASPPPIDAGGPSCSDLAQQLDAMEAQAKTCCPICNTPQCDVAVEGICCPFSVTGTPPAGFAEMLAAYKAACHPLCPAIACAIAPSNVCTPVNPGNPAGQGICQ
jgi:hypothetical protein